VAQNITSYFVVTL